MKAFGRALALFSVLFMAALPAQVVAQEVTLKVVTGTPQNLIWNQPLWSFIERVNERGKGVVQLQYVGGPEVTPVAEQFRAVNTGIIDLH